MGPKRPRNSRKTWMPWSPLEPSPQVAERSAVAPLRAAARYQVVCEALYGDQPGRRKRRRPPPSEATLGGRAPDAPLAGLASLHAGPVTWLTSPRDRWLSGRIHKTVSNASIFFVARAPAGPCGAGAEGSAIAPVHRARGLCGGARRGLPRAVTSSPSNACAGGLPPRPTPRVSPC
jgi:hypothetical protein